MPESLKEKHTQICEELDQWRSWGCVYCLTHGSTSAAESVCGHSKVELKGDKGVHKLLYRAFQGDKPGDAKPNAKHFSGLVDRAASARAESWDVRLVINKSDQRQGPPVEKPGPELVDLREGGVRYRTKLRKYVVEYRPSRFKWKLWMGTYSSQQDGRRAFDCALFYAGQGKGTYYFRDSPELFRKLGPLDRLLSQVSKIVRDKPFNQELKRRAKEIIKQTARKGCIGYHHDSPCDDQEAPAATASAGKRDEPVDVYDNELEPKENDPAFEGLEDLEPLSLLRPLLYSDDQICTDGLSHPERSGGFPFFVAGLNFMDTALKSLQSESDDSFQRAPAMDLWSHAGIFSWSCEELLVLK